MRLGSWMSAGAGLLAMASVAGLEADYYTTHIEPILRNNCYECHGEAKSKGGLRLDSPRSIMLGGREGPAVTAGHPEQSILWELVSLPADDPDIMPPEGGPLQAAELAHLQAWIAAGAPFGDAAPDGAAVAVTAKPLPRLDLDSLAADLEPIPDATLVPIREAGFKVFALSANGALVEIDAAGLRQGIDAAQLRQLQPIADRIIRLDLGGTDVTDAALAALDGFTRLRKLHLEKTAIGDAGLQHLTGLAELRYLNLYASQVSDAGLRHLHGLDKLEKVFLWQSRATEAGAEKLRAAVPGVMVNLGD